MTKNMFDLETEIANQESSHVLDEHAEYLRALITLDDLSLRLGQCLRYTRVGWDDTVTCEGVLGPINDIAFLIGKAMPASIVATRKENTE